MACTHEKALRLADGWFCPDCQQGFPEKPKAEKPKKKDKSDSKSAVK